MLRLRAFHSSLALLVGASAIALSACQSNSLTNPFPPGQTSSSPSPISTPSGVAATSTPTPRAGATATPTPSAGTTATPSGGATATPTPSATGVLTAAGAIKHIVIIIQENRTFDNVFHGFSEPSGALADAANVGYDKQGNAIPLMSVPFENQFDPNNYHADFIADYDNGKNDGFKDNNAAISGATGTGGANYGYAYLPQTEVQPYWDMATQGALAERFFHGVTGPTYPSHLMFVAGSTTYDGSTNHRVIDSPTLASLGWGCEDPNTNEKVGTLDANGNEVPGPFPCYSVTTLADLLQNAGHTWHFYSGPVQAPNSPVTAGGQTVTTPGGNLEALASYRQIYFGSTWSANAIQPETRVLTDVSAGTLADVTWVTPDGLNTDHPGEATASGPQWVASVVNTIGQSQFYKNTAIFVTWDDWGGWYDHVPPPQKYAPYGLGFRIPLILISPYAKHGVLIDTQYEPGSILKFCEEVFGLPSLGTEDATSNSLDDMFDFTQTPPAFKVVSAKLRRDYFLHQKPSYRVIDRDELGPWGVRN